MDGLAPKLEELVHNLKRQMTLHRQLMDLLRDEKEHLLNVRFKEIRESTYAKEAILDEIRREEIHRIRWVRATANALGMQASELTIEIIANKIAAPEEYEGLISLKNTLLIFVRKTKEMNLENKRLVESALKDANVMKCNLLGLSSGQPQVYGPKGNVGTVRDQSARFFSKEA